MTKFKKIGTFKTDEGNFSYYNSVDYTGPIKMFTVHESNNGYVVRNVLIPDELRRTGIATDFYKFINDISMQKTGKPLHSSLAYGSIDTPQLSKYGIWLWDSFVRKGLAVKNGDKDYVFLTNNMSENTNNSILTREQYLFESNKPKEGVLLLIHYWYNLMPTIVKVKGYSGNKILVSHKNEHSKIHNAPDELISMSQIIKKI